MGHLPPATVKCPCCPSPTSAAYTDPIAIISARNALLLLTRPPSCAWKSSTNLMRADVPVHAVEKVEEVDGDISYAPKLDFNRVGVFDVEEWR